MSTSAPLASSSSVLPAGVTSSVSSVPSSRSVVVAFKAGNSAPNIPVIKTYVRLGLGVGIVSELAFEEEADAECEPANRLVKLPIGHPFARNTTRVAYLHGRILRGYEQALIEAMKR